MSKKTIIESDLSGAEGAVETYLALDGAWYEIDLTVSEREELRALLERYLVVGRRTLNPETRKRRQVPETTVDEREEIRAWAKEHGFTIADYGRIPKRVMTAYRASAADKDGGYDSDAA